MAQHIKLLAVLHIILSSIALFAALAVLLVFGGLAGLASVSAETQDRLLAIPILGSIGAIIFIVIVAIALPGLIGGIGLLSFKPWARTMMIVVSVLDLLGFPLHTALGIYGLWVLLNQETEQMFRGRSMPVAPHV